MMRASRAIHIHNARSIELSIKYCVPRTFRFADASAVLAITAPFKSVAPRTLMP